MTQAQEANWKHLANIYGELARVAGAMPTVAGASGPVATNVLLQMIYEVVANWSPSGGGGGAPSGPAGGDLGGTYPNPTVVSVPESAIPDPLHLDNYLSIGTTPAAAGAIRLSHNSGIYARNLGDTGDQQLLATDAGGNAIYLSAYPVSLALVDEGAATDRHGILEVSDSHLVLQDDDLAGAYFNLSLNGSSSQISMLESADGLTKLFALSLAGNSGFGNAEFRLSDDEANGVKFSVSLADDNSSLVLEDDGSDLIFKVELNAVNSFIHFEDNEFILALNASDSVFVFEDQGVVDEVYLQITLSSSEIFMKSDDDNTYFYVNVNAGTRLRLQEDANATHFRVDVSNASYIWLREAIFRVETQAGNSIELDDALGFELDIGAGNYLKLDNLPTADPAASNRVWDNLGVLMKDAA